MTDLEKAIKRLNDAITAMEWQNALDELRAVCAMLQATVPGFVCPLAEQTTPPPAS